MFIITTGNSAFKISKLAKFESDTSDAGEDIASTTTSFTKSWNFIGVSQVNHGGHKLASHHINVC